METDDPLHKESVVDEGSPITDQEEEPFWLELIGSVVKPEEEEGKAHVLEQSERDVSGSAALAVVGASVGLTFEFQLLNIVLTESGERFTLPGVTCGSSSMLFICEDPFHGLPGSNSGTRSAKYDDVGAEWELDWDVSLNMSAPSDQWDRPVSSFTPDHVSGRVLPEEDPPPGARLNTSPSSFSNEGSFQVVLKRDWFCDCCWSFRLRSRNSGTGFTTSELRKKSSGAAAGTCWCFINSACCTAIWFWQLLIRCFVCVICTCKWDWKEAVAPGFDIELATWI